MEETSLREGWVKGIFVNALGEIYSAPNEGEAIKRNEHSSWKKLKLHTDEDGYRTVKVWDREKKKDRLIRVHRYVLWAFSGPPEVPEMMCLHTDGNPENNQLENLRWGTHRENMRDWRNAMAAKRASRIGVTTLFDDK